MKSLLTFSLKKIILNSLLIKPPHSPLTGGWYSKLFLFFALCSLCVSPFVFADGEGEVTVEEIPAEEVVLDSAVEMGSGEIVMTSGDAYRFGDVVVDAPLLMDLTFIGTNLETKSPISEDVLAFGNNLFVYSDIGDDAHLFGFDVVVTGNIRDNLMLTGQSIVLSSEASVGGDVWAFSSLLDSVGLSFLEIEEKVILDAPVSGNAVLVGKNIEINAPISGDVKIVAENLTLSHRIEGNADIHAQNVVFEDDGFIAGNVFLKSDTSPAEDKIGGELLFEEEKNWEKSESVITRQIGKMLTPFSLSMLLSTLILGVLIILVARNYVASFGESTRSHFFANAGIGFLLFFGVPILAILLGVTLIGLPASGILLFAYFSVVILSLILEGFVIGTLLLSIHQDSSFWRIFASFFIGTMILFLLPLGTVAAFGEMLGTILSFVVNFLLMIIAIGGIGRQHFLLARLLKEGEHI